MSLILDDDGVARHFSHLRRVQRAQEKCLDTEDDDWTAIVSEQGVGSDDKDYSETNETVTVVPLRLSTGTQEHSPCWLQDYTVED